ncbi:MAG: CxxC-x17-CxxC domain-containing protein, partial [bacterium]
MDTQDRKITCVTCGQEFIFTAREQEFFISKGFKEPKHCRECRQKRKREHEQTGVETTSRTPHPRKEMFPVTCAKCGRETQVPFKPVTGKPVLCKDCFIDQRYGIKVKAQPAESEAVQMPESEAAPPEEPTVQASVESTAPPAEGEAVQMPETEAAPPEEPTVQASAESTAQPAEGEAVQMPESEAAP